jgi:undecaprenyl-diphosphatase
LNVQQSLVLGIIQGLTEYIPVSSTAHLILAQIFFSTGLTPAHPHTFDTVIQFGTVVPVLIYFRRDWLRMLRAAMTILANRRVGQDDPYERLVPYVLLGSIPAGILGLVLEKHIEKLADPSNDVAKLYIGGALVVVGILMYWVDKTGVKSRGIESLALPDALFIGFAQAAALFPGVSRSGATITAGLFTGLSREAAARFSFLLMTPIMLAATGYKLVKMLRGSETMAPGELEGMLLATVVAAISGYAAIAFLLGWLRTRSMGTFAFYRILLGALTIGMYFLQRSA